MFINDAALSILHSKNYRHSSIITFDNAIKRIFKDTFPGKPYNGLRFKTDSQKIIDTIKSYPEIRQRMYMYCVKLLYNGLDTKFKSDDVTKLYNDLYESISYEHNNSTTMLEPTEKQSERFVTTDELNTVYDTYQQLYNINDDYESAIKFLIISLYKFMPPLRPQIYINTTFEEYEPLYPTLNVIDLDSKTILIKSSKMLKGGRTQTINIPDNLINLISAIRTKYNTLYLITKLSDENEQLTESNFSHMFSHMFFMVIGRRISPNNIRNSYVSNLIDEHGIANSDERRKIAKIMGHSVNTQNNIYSKYSKLIHPK